MCEGVCVRESVRGREECVTEGGVCVCEGGRSVYIYLYNIIM